MRFCIEKHINATPEQVWPLIAIPSRMSEWSLAPIRSISPGDQGHPGTTGALRSVAIVFSRRPALGSKFVEVIERGEAPHRVHYRLVAGYPLEAHRGEVELSEISGGTHLSWSVDARLGAGLDGVVSRRVERDLARSLDRLEGFLEDPEPLPTLAPIETASALLWAAAESLLAMQRQRAASLSEAGDPRSWFARIYSVVTERLLEQARSGVIVHPAWLLRLIPIFERYYADNLAAYSEGRAEDLESHWARAFRVAGRTNGVDSIGPGLFHGIRAHVEGDLGRSLGEVYAAHYAESVDYVRFRADYLAMNSIFRGAAETMFTEVPTRAMPLWFRALRRTLPVGLFDLVRDRTFYDMPKQRRRAFEDGARIARVLARQKKSAASL